MSEKGKLSLPLLQSKAEAGEIETVIAAFTDHIGRLMGKRFDVFFFLENTARHGTHACNYLLTTDPEMTPLTGFSSANWDLGYGDFLLMPDMATLREITWQPKTALVLCDLRSSSGEETIEQAPRSILKKQVEAARNMGFECQAASELEFFIFENSYREAFEKGYHNLRPTNWYLEDYNILSGTRIEPFMANARRQLGRSGVPIEGSKGEWGHGQQEINLCHAPVLDMADRHILFKQCLKELAGGASLSVTFMAKFHEDQAGSSCHLHLNLLQEGKNAFAGDKQNGPILTSDIFRWFLGGWMAHIPEVMPFYAPTINSYKRYQTASWAPTRIGWSHDNRTVGFRVVGNGANLRIECRIPGADANPYLAYAAAIASGLDGITNQIEPPPMSEGNHYAVSNLPRLPHHLSEAVAVFENSRFSNLAFGRDVVQHYAHFFRKELETFDRAVTDWERRRYFERI